VAMRGARSARIRWPPPSGIRPSFLWSWVDERARVIMDVADRDTAESIGIAQVGV